MNTDADFPGVEIEVGGLGLLTLAAPAWLIDYHRDIARLAERALDQSIDDDGDIDVMMRLIVAAFQLNHPTLTVDQFAHAVDREQFADCWRTLIALLTEAMPPAGERHDG